MGGLEGRTNRLSHSLQDLTYKSSWATWGGIWGRSLGVGGMAAQGAAMGRAAGVSGASDPPPQGKKRKKGARR